MLRELVSSICACTARSSRERASVGHEYGLGTEADGIPVSAGASRIRPPSSLRCPTLFPRILPDVPCRDFVGPRYLPVLYSDPREGGTLGLFCLWLPEVSSALLAHLLPVQH